MGKKIFFWWQHIRYRFFVIFCCFLLQIDCRFLGLKQFKIHFSLSPCEQTNTHVLDDVQLHNHPLNHACIGDPGIAHNNSQHNELEVVDAILGVPSPYHTVQAPYDNPDTLVGNCHCDFCDIHMSRLRFPMHSRFLLLRLLLLLLLSCTL